MHSEAKEEKSNPADDSEIFLPSHNNTTDVDINPNCEPPSISEQPSHQINKQEPEQTPRLQISSQKTENEVAKPLVQGWKNRSKYNNSMFHLPQEANLIRSTFKNSKFSQCYEGSRNAPQACPQALGSPILT